MAGTEASTSLRALESSGAASPISDAGPSSFLHWCGRSGSSVLEREEVMYAIGSAFVQEQARDCRSALLTEGMTDTQRNDWLNYIIVYTYALAGCELVFGPPEGGIEVFGLANTDVAAGFPRGPLGADDVEVLIELYLRPFGSNLRLSQPELLELAAYLRSTAAPEIDRGVTSTLSRCSADGAGG